MQLGLSLEINVPSDTDTAALLLLGRMYAPPGTVNAENPLTVEEAVEYLFDGGAGVNFLSEMGVTWHAIRTGEVVPDVAPDEHSRQRLDNQPG